MMICIQLNGEGYECEENLSLIGLLRIFKKNPQHHVIECNGCIVERDSYERTLLQNGDVIEILAFVGGGSQSITISAKKKQLQSLTLYPVTCESLSLGRLDYDIAKLVFEGGASILQYRNKNDNFDKKQRVLSDLRILSWQYGALLIVNDSVELAQSVQADGVHLGQTDMSCSRARKILGDQYLIGISCHNLQEALLAQSDGANYVNIGPVFDTKTKNKVSGPVGLSVVKKVLDVLDIPMTVMGGISFENLDLLLKLGVSRFAMVTALTKAKNVTEETKKYIRYISTFDSKDREI